MKIWKGPELEGNRKGVKTLFVKDNEVSGHVVVDYLMRNPDCKRVYLGAGRTDVTALYPEKCADAADIEFRYMLNFCKQNDIEIALEVSVDGIRKVPDVLWENVSQTIVRVLNKDLRLLSTSDCIKIDDERDVYVVEVGHMIHTSLNTLHGDTFEADTVLFDEEEKR